MSRKEQIALWVGGVVFGALGAGALVLFLSTALNLGNQLAGCVWAIGLAAIGLAICRFASHPEHSEAE